MGADLPVFQELRTVQQEEQHYADLQRQRYDAAEPAGVFNEHDENWDESPPALQPPPVVDTEPHPVFDSPERQTEVPAQSNTPSKETIPRNRIVCADDAL